MTRRTVRRTPAPMGGASARGRGVISGFIMALCAVFALGMGAGPARADIDPAARGLAITALSRGALLGNTVCWFGDSRIAHSFNDATALGSPYVNRGPTYWARFYTKQRIVTDATLNFGVSGDTTTLMVARLNTAVSACAARKAGFVVILAGVNDPPASISLTTTMANLTTIYQAFRRAGIYVIFVPELASGSTTNQAAQEAMHRKIMELSTVSGVFVADPWPDYTDPLTGLAKTNYNDGGVHPTARGARVIGRALANVFNTLLPEAPILPATNTDQWSATNPHGNLLTNPMLLTGTGGATGTLNGSNNANVPDGWALTSPAGVTVTPTITTDSNGYPALKLDISGTPSSAGAQFIVLTQTTGSTVNAGLVTNDQIEGAAAIELTNLVGVLATEIQLSDDNSGTLATDALPGGTATRDYMPTVVATETGALRSPALIVAAGHSSVTGRFQVCLFNSVAASGSITISRFGVRKTVP